MAADPVLASSSRRAATRTAALQLAVSRDAAIRLAPVVSALAERGMPQVLADLRGERPVDPDTPPHTPAEALREDAVAELIDRVRPAYAVVAGDDDAAVAAALAAYRAGVPVARLGAGLRSGDRSSRAELNRLVLDELASLLLVDGERAAGTLEREGADAGRIRRVGSTVPDVTLRWRLAAAPRRAGVPVREYVLVAVQQPSARLIDGLGRLAERERVVACPPVDVGVAVAPRDYLDRLSLVLGASAVLTDSGVVQEETTVLGVPCFTVAQHSERVETLLHGTNALLGDDPEDVGALTLGSPVRAVSPIPLWDGRAGRRAADALLDWSGTP